jgi:hypothetical protein
VSTAEGSGGESSRPQSATRHAPRAVIAGLGPSVVPKMILELWTQGRRFGFEGQGGGFDQRWAVVWPGFLVPFVIIFVT